LRRAAIFPLLGPALVLYLIADVASLRGELDGLGYAIALVAVCLSFAIVGRGARTGERGSRSAALLGLCSGVALLPLLTDEPLRISVELAQTVALVTLGALVLDLALFVPDRALSVRVSRALRWAALAAAVSCGLASALVQGPVVAPLGAPWLVPELYLHAAPAFAAVAVMAALVLRLLRRRLGSGPEALASNGWAVLGLAPAGLLCVALLARHLVAGAWSMSLLRLFGTLCAPSLYFGHLWLLDPSRRLSASRATRDFAAGAVTLGLAALAVVRMREYLPHAPVALALWTAVTLLLAFGLLHTLRPLSRRWLAPAGGALLEQLQLLQGSMGGVHTLEGLVRVVLAAFRRAAGTAAQPLLYGFDPGFEGRIDAAGEPHLCERALHPAILSHLRQQPAEILVRAPLEARIVREPPLRPLIEALVELDALCVLPLFTDGELEGALIVPRGNRRAPLTLEELAALREHARWLAGFVSVFSAKGRAQARAHELIVTHGRSESRIERLEDEAARLRADVEALHAAGPARAQAAPLIAYSAAMRDAVDRLRPLCAHDVPLLFIAEAGVSVEPLARFVHTESARASEAFLCVDCTVLKPEQACAVLFGGVQGGVRHPGALRLAAAGTLLLNDVAALPVDAQRMLVAALASRTGRPLEGGEAYPLSGRVTASSRVDLEALAQAGGFDSELGSRLCAVACRIPPLRERRQDIASHALLAVDRACKRLGHAPVGFEPAALEQLSALDLAGNELELEALIERAVAQCRSERISVADLPLMAASALRSDVGPLEGTLEEVECRALQHALSRAGGNKSEAARLLGLPRTTFLDKLRRHKLDDGTRENSSPPN
jgi:two-component system response regulator HydG